jgi:hypothetical protein
MAANIKFELVTKVQRGDKERWQKLGVVFENDRGMYAIIDQIPVGFSGMVSFFEPKEREDQQKKTKPAATFDEDAPW